MEEQLINPYDKEYMKMAMLKHEETFKQQVYELHRLYRIQKILMKGMINNDKSRRRRPNPINIGLNQEERSRCEYYSSSTTGGILSLHPLNIDENHDHRYRGRGGGGGRVHQKPGGPAGIDLERQPPGGGEYVPETESDHGYGPYGDLGRDDQQLGIEDESEIELTLGPTINYLYGRKKAAGTPPTNSAGSALSLSSSSTGSSSHMKKKTTTTTSTSGSTYQGTDSRREFTGRCPSRARKHSTTFDVEEELIRQDRTRSVLKQPPWLLQALSLNMST